MEEKTDLRSVFERIVGRLAFALGKPPKVLLLLFGSLSLLLLAGLYLSAVAAQDLAEQYSPPTGEVAPSERSELETDLRERVKLPTLIMEGDVLPDAPLRPDGTVLRCSPLLQGSSGLTRGWLWTEEDKGCRRVARQAR